MTNEHEIKEFPCDVHLERHERQEKHGVHFHEEHAPTRFAVVEIKTLFWQVPLTECRLLSHAPGEHVLSVAYQ